MDYGEIVKKAIEAVKKHKWLVVWGLFFSVVFAGGSSNYSNVSRSFDKFGENTDWSYLEKVDFEKIWSIFWETIGSYYWEIIASTPWWVWVFIILVVLFSWGFWFLYGIFLKNYIKAGMIKLSYEAVSDREVNLEVGSKAGFKSFMKVFLASLLIGIVSILGVGAIGFVTFILAMIPFVGVIFIFVGVLVILVFVIYIMVCEMVASWSVVVGGKEVIEAVGIGLRVGFKKFFNLLVIGLINTCSGCLVLLVIGIVMLVVGLVVLGSGVGLVAVLKMFSLIFLPIGLVLMVVVIVFSSLVMAGLAAFRHNTWSLTYKELIEEDGGENE